MSVQSGSLHPAATSASSLIDDLRRAARATRAAIVTLVLSAAALGLFFGGVGAVFGPINDVLLGVTFVLLVPAMLVTHRLAARRWFTVLAIVGVIGVAELVIGQLLLVTGIISLQTSFNTLGLGFVAFAAWACGLAILAYRRAILSPTLAWWAIGFVVALVLAAVAWAVLPLAAWSTFGLALLITFVGWLVSVNRALVRAAGA